jgi:hypothetical protein
MMIRPRRASLRLTNDKSIRAYLLSVLILIVMTLQGCIWAENREMSAAYNGKVLDAETKQPVARARLEIRFLDMKTSTKSESDGSFRLGPLKHFQVGIITMEGPKPDRRSMPERLFLSISCRDYQDSQVLVPSETTFWVSPVKTNGTWHGSLELGNILLHPAPSTRK